MEQDAEDAVCLSDLVFVEVDVQPLAAQGRNRQSAPVVTQPWMGSCGLLALRLKRCTATSLAAHCPRPSGMLSFFASTTATMGAST